MKKTLSILLTLMMLVGILAVSAVSVSAAVKTTDSAFTDNYVLLDYIQNTNGQYIKTGYKAGAKVTVSMDMEITNWKSEWSGIFGSRTADPSTDAFIAYRNKNNNSAYTKIGKANATEYSSLTLNTRTTLSLSGNSNFSGTGVELTLFGINNNGTCDAKGAAVYKLYSCKITDDGKVVRDFVPAQRKSDGAKGLFDLQNGVFYPSANGVSFEGEASAVSSLPTTTTNYTSDITIDLKADQDVPSYIQVSNGATVNLYLNGHTLTYTNTNTNSMFWLTGGNLNIYGSGTIKSVGKAKPAKGGFCHISATSGQSKLTIASGSTVNIQGFIASEDGGAIYVANGGAVEMNGGVISGCSAGDNGGVIDLEGGTFTMNGGELHDNTAVHSGGAVFLYKETGSSTFTMNGGKIYNNKTTAVCTSTSYYWGGGTFTMNGGELHDNTAVHSGGAVFLYKETGSSTFTMNGGKIYNNKTTAVCTSTSYYWGGGGVCVYGGTTFNMNGGNIYGNTSANEGGGVLVYGYGGTATFNMKGGTIENNTASKGDNADVATMGTNAKLSQTCGRIGENLVHNYHTFDKNGICTGCNATYTNCIYSGAMLFEGADRISVIIRADDNARAAGKYYIKDINGLETTLDVMTEIVIDGNYVHVNCNRLGYYFEIFPIYNDTKVEVLPAGCEDGYSEYSYAGLTHQMEIVPGKGHHFNQKKPDKIVAPTCAEVGYTLRFCDDCDYAKRINVIPSLPHEFDKTPDKIVAPTCAEEGCTLRYCDNCDYVERFNVIPSLPHKFNKNMVCTDCGKPFSISDFANGAAGYNKVLIFPGAASVTVKFSYIGVNDYLRVYDGNGNEKAVATIYWNNLEGGNTVTVSGDTVRITAAQTCGGSFTIESVTPNYGSATGSVLSEGNLWIVIGVAVLVVLGAAALIIVKKKKKPIAANGASTEDEE